jgi:hypothetical protein
LIVIYKIRQQRRCVCSRKLLIKIEIDNLREKGNDNLREKGNDNLREKGNDKMGVLTMRRKIKQRKAPGSKKNR